VLTEVDDLRRVEATDIALQIGEATYLGFGPSTSMNGNGYYTRLYEQILPIVTTALWRI